MEIFTKKRSFYGYVKEVLEPDIEKIIGRSSCSPSNDERKAYQIVFASQDWLDQLKKDYAEYEKNFVEPEPIKFITADEKKAFWDLVKFLDYNRDRDYERCQKLLRKTYTKEELEKYDNIYSLYYRKLARRVDEEYDFNKEFRGRNDVGMDDAWSDCEAQMIANGEACYKSVIEDPFNFYGHSFSESFSYVWHSDD